MNRRHAIARVRRLLQATFAVVAMCLLAVLPGPARADEAADDGIVLGIERITAVVTEDSGFSLTITVRNTASQDAAAGKLDVRVASDYVFVSRTDLQEWADGTGGIDTPDELLQVDVPAIRAGEQASVTGKLNADADQLKALASWGPRPLSITYVTGDGVPAARLTSFLTRSQDGLHGERTPPLNLTVAMPLATDGWQADAKAEEALETGTKQDPDTVVALDDEQREALKAKDQLGQRFADLQTVADPDVLAAIGTPHHSGIMQPSAFDITTYARVADASAYTAAGVDTASWNADTAQATMRAALGDDDAQADTYAWQGADSWTMDALAAARAQGYETAIATDDFALTDGATAVTQVYRVPTDAGTITVLAAQPTLTKLAGQQATSAQAAAEHSDAGRLARIIAQSAFYQMEQPYESRALLMCVGESMGADQVAALMEALGQASWLNLQSLHDLATQPSTQVDEAMLPALIGESVGTVATETGTVREALRSLATSRERLVRFGTSVIEDNTQEAQQWADGLVNAHDRFALAAAGPDAGGAARMAQAAAAFSDGVYGEVKLVPSGSVNVVSETASMPVTVSNGLPFPIAVQVSSITDSMEIVTERFTDITVPAHSEAQTSIAIRVSTSGTTTAREQLVDREGESFGESAQTTITSSLQLSDKSGVILIALAVALGVVGLYRQTTRKKDPDE